MKDMEEVNMKRENIWVGINTKKMRVLDELTKKIKVKVTDFNEKFDHYAFHDWMVSLKDYFEWFFSAWKQKGQVC